MLRDYLKLQLFSAESGLMTVGSVSLGGRAVKIFAKLGQLLSDGDGLRIALQWGGQGCMKPCWRHCNVLRKRSRRAEHNEGYVDISCVSPDEFVTWDNDELNKAIDLLILARERAGEGAIFKARLEEMTRAFGFSPTSDGLLACPTLKGVVAVASAARYDWAHTFLADGLLTTSAWLLINAAERSGLAKQQDIHDI